MRWLRDALPGRLRLLFRRGRLEDDMDRELRFHLEQQVTEHVAAGLSPTEARRRARLGFGQVDVVKDDCRQAWGLRLVDDLGSDLWFGVRAGLVRVLRRSPDSSAYRAEGGTS